MPRPVESIKLREALWIIALSSLIVIALDAVTNSIDIHRNGWDFAYYIAMARDGFHADPLASPFAYRYISPLIVHGLTSLGLTIEQGFGLLAYLGAIGQLSGVYFFVRWLTGSRKGACLGLGVTALSLYNVKFLLFDIYRPDHLAYALILLQTYLAFKKNFAILLIVTLFASQVREFNIIPLVAYLFMTAPGEDGKTWVRQLVTSMIFLIPAILLPRILIPVSENFQLLSLSREGLMNVLLLPLIPSISLNFIFSTAAYFLPLFFLAGSGQIIEAYFKQPVPQRRYLTAYTVLVLLLSLYGGTDLFRFATFLFLPQIILIGEIGPRISIVQVIAVFAVVFIFNRIWMSIPDWDVDKYRDFYGGYSLRLNESLLRRAFELGGILIVGIGIRRLKFVPGKSEF
ncbi:MAG: hypothetical protein K8S20_18040 [Chloroflexi bacterium]|nr:hypothetical protein [Chloroflexota bacterium]